MNEIWQTEKFQLMKAAVAILITSLLNLGAPTVMGYAIDTYLAVKDYEGVQFCGGVMLAMFAVAFVSQYFQSLWMGAVGQRVVYRLRDQVFHKLQGLPLAFFSRHKAGDLISRINHDTNKVNSFFSQSLMRFVGSVVTMTGAVSFLLILNPRLGLVAILPAIVMAIVTVGISPWIRRQNAANLVSVGEVSAEISESLENFKVVAAFDRRDFFREHFQTVNEANYQQSLRTGIANGVLAPLFSLCSQSAQLLVLVFGLYLIGEGEFTVGLLISYFVYVSRLYDPMRQIAALWATYQAARAGLDRIQEILREDSELEILDGTEPSGNSSRLEFREVSFAYVPGQNVLHQSSFKLEAGKTYAFVGPTGGGKTTTASLMARMFDPLSGEVFLDGVDIRSIPTAQRCQKIGFILQEPFLFAETVGDNVSSVEGFETLFDEGLETPVDSLSLGQRQVVAFLRAVERKPDLLILDEATANIDTVTEKTLERLLERLPDSTTRVVIAHRFGTIESADEIFFVNAQRVVPAGSICQAVNLLKEEARSS